MSKVELLFASDSHLDVVLTWLLAMQQGAEAKETLRKYAGNAQETANNAQATQEIFRKCSVSLSIGLGNAQEKFWKLSRNAWKCPGNAREIQEMLRKHLRATQKMFEKCSGNAHQCWITPLQGHLG